MESLHKYLVVYDLVTRTTPAFNFLRFFGAKKYEYNVTRADEFQTFMDDTHLYTFVEGVKTRNKEMGYARIVIKRVFNIGSEMNSVEFNDFYNTQSDKWQSSYAGMIVTGVQGLTVPDGTLVDCEQIESNILAKGSEVGGKVLEVCPAS